MNTNDFFVWFLLILAITGIASNFKEKDPVEYEIQYGEREATSSYFQLTE